MSIENAEALTFKPASPKRINLIIILLHNKHSLTGLSIDEIHAFILTLIQFTGEFLQRPYIVVINWICRILRNDRTQSVYVIYTIKSIVRWIFRWNEEQKWSTLHCKRCLIVRTKEFCNSVKTKMENISEEREYH